MLANVAKGQWVRKLVRSYGGARITVGGTRAEESNKGSTGYKREGRILLKGILVKCGAVSPSYNSRRGISRQCGTENSVVHSVSGRRIESQDLQAKAEGSRSFIRQAGTVPAPHGTQDERKKRETHRERRKDIDCFMEGGEGDKD